MTKSIFHQYKKPIKKALLKQAMGHNALIVYHRPDTNGRKCGYWNMDCYVDRVYRDYIFVIRRERRWRLYTKYIMEVEVRD